MIPSGGDGSEETIWCTMYHKCLQLARWKVGVRSSVVGGRFSLTSAQLPTCGRLRIFLHNLFFFRVIDTPPSQWRKIYKNILCTKHWISDDRQRYGSKSACIHSSTLMRQWNVLNWSTLQCLIPSAKCINFATEKNQRQHLVNFVKWLLNYFTWLHDIYITKCCH